MVAVVYNVTIHACLVLVLTRTIAINAKQGENFIQGFVMKPVLMVLIQTTWSAQYVLNFVQAAVLTSSV
jgi:hypothetical protein